MSPDFQTEEITADKPAIGSPRWYATNLDYYKRALGRAVELHGERWGIRRIDRKLVHNVRMACTVCRRPKCGDSTHVKRTEGDLVLRIGTLNPFGSQTENESDRLLYWFWLRDSLLWAIEEYQANRPLYALRGLLQAAGYAGKLEGLGGAPHDVTSADAFGTLKNAVEACMRTELS